MRRLTVICALVACSSHPPRDPVDAGPVPGTPDVVDGDHDDDGIYDVDDNCPLRANPDQADDDGDRIGNECERAFRFDFDGDRKADLGVYTPSTGEWRIRSSLSGTDITFMTAPSGTPAPEDYDGDQRFDGAVFNAGTWTIRSSRTGMLDTVTLGTTGDVPVPADYDGDGRADVAVFAPTTCTWTVRRSYDDVVTVEVFPSPAVAGSFTAVGDYDRDRSDDLAVFTNRTGGNNWYRRLSNTSFVQESSFGVTGDLPIMGDWDGDGLLDAIVWRPTTREWFTSTAAGGFVGTQPFGLVGDLDAMADYDGNGKSDLGVYRPSNGTFYTTTNMIDTDMTALGSTGDVPINTPRR